MVGDVPVCVAGCHLTQRSSRYLEDIEVVFKSLVLIPSLLAGEPPVPYIETHPTEKACIEAVSTTLMSLGQGNGLCMEAKRFDLLLEGDFLRVHGER